VQRREGSRWQMILKILLSLAIVSLVINIMQYFNLFENSAFLTIHGMAACAKDKSLSCIAKKPELMRLALQST
jgi:hypothetical protein